MNCKHCKKPIRKMDEREERKFSQYHHHGFVHQLGNFSCLRVDHYAEPCTHTSDWWKNFERCACCGAEYNEAEMLRIAEPEDR